MHVLQDGYRTLIRKLLKHKAAVLATSVALLALSLFLATQLDTELMPMTDDGIIAISIDFQPGLTIEEIDKVATRAEEYIAQDEDVESYLLSYGSTGLNVGLSGGGSGISLTGSCIARLCLAVLFYSPLTSNCR